MKNINKEELHTLIEKIKSNDKVAYDNFYEKYKSLVYGISFTICKNHEIADEVTQNVFFKIWKLSEDKFPTAYEASWLYTITKNETIDVLRKSFEYVDIESIYNIQDYNSDISDLVDSDSFSRMIEGLKEDEKQIISLRVISDFTFKEIAELLNVPIATVQWKYYKSIKSLKLALANLAMFILTFGLYLRTRFVSNNKANKSYEMSSIDNSKTADNYESSSSSGGVSIGNVSIIPNTISNGTQTSVSSFPNINSSTITLGISSVFLILTLIFVIFVKKRQQKLKPKTSKHYMGN